MESSEPLMLTLARLRGERVLRSACWLWEGLAPAPDPSAAPLAAATLPAPPPATDETTRNAAAPKAALAPLRSIQTGRPSIVFQSPQKHPRLAIYTSSRATFPAPPSRTVPGPACSQRGVNGEKRP